MKIIFQLLFVGSLGCWWKKEAKETFQEKNESLPKLMTKSEKQVVQPKRRIPKLNNNRRLSQKPYGPKQPQEVIKRSSGQRCLADRSGNIKHSCQKPLNRGEVCKAQTYDCVGCLENDHYVEIVVRCAQAAMSNAFSLRYTMMKKCKGMAVRGKVHLVIFVLIHFE